VTALEFLGWAAALSVSLMLVSIAVLVMVGALVQIAKPKSNRARKVSPKE
jgi:hypothetical protein